MNFLRLATAMGAIGQTQNLWITNDIHEKLVMISATKSAGVGNVLGRNTRTAFVGWTYSAIACAIQAHHIAATVASWLADLDAWTPLVELLGRAAHDDDWPAIHAIADCLSVEDQMAA
jgi:hypothetical protein